jgi:hypothetical protein
MKWVIFLRALSIYKSSCKFIIDGLIDRPEITNDSFFDELIRFMSSLVKYIPKKTVKSDSNFRNDMLPKLSMLQ